MSHYKFCIIFKGMGQSSQKRTSQSDLSYGDSTDEVHEGCLEPSANNYVCIICKVISAMHSLGMNFIAPSPRSGYKPVHNMPCAVH
jgi:hypothetical protein